MSNAQELEVFITHRPDFMSHLLLSHLSQDNNRPELVYELFKKHANGTEIIVASRYAETEVYHITGLAVSAQKPVVAQPELVQFSLF